MKVATYTQPSVVTRGSVVAIATLIVSVILGTSAFHTLLDHFAPASTRLDALMWLALYGVASLGLMFNHGINWVSWLMRYRILLVILLIGTIMSVFWSIDQAVSAERTVHVIGCSVLAIYLGFMVPLLTTLRVFGVVLGVILIAGVAAAFAIPDLGIELYEGQLVWKGILNSKNSLGFWSAIGVLLYLTLLDSSNSLFMKFVCLIMAAVAMGSLWFSESATSLLAMMIGGSISLYLFFAFRFHLGFARMLIMAVLFIGLVGLGVSNIDTAELVGRTGDLTGRGEVWRQTWKLIMDRPLTGYGYGAIWFPNDATLWIQQSLTDFTWTVYHAHNGFLQVASEIGLPLSCVALLMVAQQLVEIFYCQYERQQVGVLFVLSFALAYLISNFSEARFLVNRELYWVFFIALPISMLRQITLQSADPVSQSEPLDDPGGPGIGSAKPWLRPTGAQPSLDVATASPGAAALVALGPDDDRKHIDLGEDFDESADSPGPNPDDFRDESSFPDAPPNGASTHSASPIDDLSEPYDDLSEPYDEFDDTVYDQHDIQDRYDKTIDDAGDWQDFDPDDSMNDSTDPR